MRSRVRRSAGARGVRCVCSRGEAGAWTCGIRPGRAPRRYGAPIALEAMKAMRSGPISRVLSRTIIYLVCALPRSSPHATRARAGPAHGAPIRACHDAGGLLHHRFSFSLTRRRRAAGVFFSAALSVGSPRLAVSQLPALWSPDFPHAHRVRNGSRDRLARFAMRYCTMCRRSCERGVHDPRTTSARGRRDLGLSSGCARGPALERVRLWGSYG